MTKRFLGIAGLSLATAIWCTGQDSGTKTKTQTLPQSQSATVPEQLRVVEGQIREQQVQMARQQAQIAQQQAEIGQLELQLRQNAANLQAQGEQLQRSMQQAARMELAANSASATSSAAAMRVDQTLVETQKSLQDLEHPQALHFKGITLTSGGFVAQKPRMPRCPNWASLRRRSGK
jgi:hypothetical protein